MACKTKRKFKATTDSKHDEPISPNLLDREFDVGRPDRVYVGDITYIHTLKTELIHHEAYQTRSAAKQAVFEYIEVFYNKGRMHPANGYVSPVDYELQQMAA